MSIIIVCVLVSVFIAFIINSEFITTVKCEECGSKNIDTDSWIEINDNISFKCNDCGHCWDI